MKVDLISFPCCAWTFQSEPASDRGDRHKLVFFCSPNPACSNPFPFRSSPWFLSKTRVHGSPWSKYDGHELKSVITWWLSWRARARVMGPEIGTCIGIDASVVWMSSSRRAPELNPCVWWRMLYCTLYSVCIIKVCTALYNCILPCTDKLACSDILRPKFYVPKWFK